MLGIYAGATELFAVWSTLNHVFGDNTKGLHSVIIESMASFEVKTCKR